MEIERKFTLKRLPEGLDSFPHKEIIQGYLNRNPVLRVRKYGDEYILTFKKKLSGGNGAPIKNIEEEYEIDRKSFEHLLEKCDGNIIRKTRYRIPVGEFTAELDIFSGYLEGLVFAEVEFPDEESSYIFEAPDWFDKDVTDDKRYSNGRLTEGNPFL